MMPVLNEADWEAMWAPYDEATYQSVLTEIRPSDVVLDIGAGDLRLSFRMASICRQVVAIEIQKALIEAGKRAAARPLPNNLAILPGDARLLPFPPDVTIGVLLMRHCTHFELYARKLKQAGASRMITNARWRLGIEIIDLRARALPYRAAGSGWYACGCGATGFKCDSIENLSPAWLATTTEVENCPSCQPALYASRSSDK